MTQPESKLDQLLRQRAEIDELLRRQQTPITVLFTDIVGSTSYFDQYGDTAGMVMLQRHEDVATKAVEEFGGRTIKNIGDSVMAEFPDPLAAVRAAMEIQRRLMRMNSALPERDRLQLRVGINHGMGFRQEGDVYGDVVNTASRIMKKTGPAQICVGRAVREALAAEPSIRVNALGEVTLAGKEEKERIFEVVWTATMTYVDLRKNVTSALRRGDLVAPGVNVSDLAEPVAPTMADPTRDATPAPPANERTVATPWGTPPPGATPSGLANATPASTVSLESRYELMDQLGAGGMGLVYKARDLETGDLVALKMLRPEVAENVKGMARFKNELRIARRITHKNVCRIYEFNRTPTTAYISMEFVEGESLRHVLSRQGALPTDRAIDIGRQMCAGLREAHAQGVVHRDLKPENVMIDPAGVVKIMDFGIAHSALGAGMTQTDAIVGTPTYMSPEQAEGKKVDPRTDIYALGLILFEMVAGTPTFTADTPVAVAIKHIREAPESPRKFAPHVPAHIEAAIMKCLEKKPDSRFQTIDQLEAALLGVRTDQIEQINASEPGTVRVAPGPPPRPAPPQAVTQMAQTPWEATPGPQPNVTPPPAYVPSQAPDYIQPATPQAAPAPQAAVPAPARAPEKHGVSAGLLVAIVLGALLMFGGAGYFAWRMFFKPADDSASMLAQQESAAQPAAAPATQPANTAPAQPAPAPAETPAASTPQPEASAPPGPAKATPAPAAKSEPAPSRPAAPPPEPPLVLSFAMSHTLAGHTQSVTSVAISGDGRWAATGGRDRTVRVWEFGTGRQAHMLRGHADAVSSVSLTPDGSIVASGGLDRTVRLWDARGGRELTALPKESAPVLSVAFSSDGRLLAYSTTDGRVRVWDMSSQSGVQLFTGHSGPVYSVVFSRDGRWLASAGRDQTARIWSMETGNEAAVLRGHSAAVNAVAISPDGRYAATGSEDKTVALWEISTGRLIRKFEGHTAGVTGVVFGVGGGADGRWLASAGDDMVVRVWEVSTGRDITTMSGHLRGITHLTASRDGRYLASSAGDNSVRIWRKE